MFVGTLSYDDDFHSWRKLTRNYIMNAVQPTQIKWMIQPPGDLFTRNLDSADPDPQYGLKISRAHFLQIVEAFHASDPQRFTALYRFIFALHMRDQACLNEAIPRLEKLALEGVVNILALRTKFISQQDNQTRHSRSEKISLPKCRLHPGQALAFTRLTPGPWTVFGDELTIRWTGREIYFSAGQHTPEHSSIQDEVIWGAGYWRDLIDLRIRGNIPTAPSTSPRSLSSAPSRRKAYASMRARAVDCCACELCVPATRTVFGEGSVQAKIMLIGEQPGDQEDLNGRPFVGPAGALLNRCLATAGLKREELYVTNAVKHFRFIDQSGRRLHQKPLPSHIASCKRWLTQEVALITPGHIVILGASAAFAMLGRPVTIGRERSHMFKLGESNAIITVHPSYLLRLNNEADKIRETERFIQDLRLVADASRKLATPALEVQIDDR